MERIFGLAKAVKFKRPVATLGVFDGVHRGHQAVLAETVKWAGEIDGTSVAITFDRHPASVLGGRTPESLTSLEHRLSLIEKAGVDAALVLHFDRELADMEPEEFVKDILVDKLGVVGGVLGFNNRFGKGGRGDAELLEKMGREYGFEVRTAPPLLIKGTPVSSTLIRRLISNRQLAEAAELMGRPVSLRGIVIHGDKRGRRLGFPTANLNLHHEVTPPPGVYLARVCVEDGGRYWGLVNIGTRPTFIAEDGARKTIEVHIDSFNGDLYGKVIEVEIVLFLRAEKRFESSEELTRQMEKDRRVLETFRKEHPAPA